MQNDRSPEADIAFTNNGVASKRNNRVYTESSEIANYDDQGPLLNSGGTLISDLCIETCVNFFCFQKCSSKLLDFYFKGEVDPRKERMVMSVGGYSPAKNPRTEKRCKFCGNSRFTSTLCDISFLVLKIGFWMCIGCCLLNISGMSMDLMQTGSSASDTYAFERSSSETRPSDWGSSTLGLGGLSGSLFSMGSWLWNLVPGASLYGDMAFETSVNSYAVASDEHAQLPKRLRYLSDGTVDPDSLVERVLNGEEEEEDDGFDIDEETGEIVDKWTNLAEKNADRDGHNDYMKDPVSSASGSEDLDEDDSSPDVFDIIARDSPSDKPKDKKKSIKDPFDEDDFDDDDDADVTWDMGAPDHGKDAKSGKAEKFSDPLEALDEDDEERSQYMRHDFLEHEQRWDFLDEDVGDSGSGEKEEKEEEKLDALYQKWMRQHGSNWLAKHREDHPWIEGEEKQRLDEFEKEEKSIGVKLDLWHPFAPKDKEEDYMGKTNPLQRGFEQWRKADQSGDSGVGRIRTFLEGNLRRMMTEMGTTWDAVWDELNPLKEGEERGERWEVFLEEELDASVCPEDYGVAGLNWDL